ncbi:MAG: SRPBCC family protein [Saprospiraceae bacterium]
MKWLKYLLYLLLGLAGLVAALSFFAQTDYHIERSVEIDAPHALVYDQIRYFKNFADWSPWQDLDPKMKTEIAGADGEAGAVYKWAGNKDVGVGSITYRSVNPERIAMDLAFVEPWESASPAEYRLEDLGASTRVFWATDMRIGRPWNAFAMFTDLDLAIGKDYDKGLAKLKKLCEDLARTRYGGFDIRETTFEGGTYLTTARKRASFAETAGMYAAAIPGLRQTAVKSGLEQSGLPIVFGWLWDQDPQQAERSWAIPIKKPATTVKGYEVIAWGPSKAFATEYYGAYEGLEKAHAALRNYVADRGLKPEMPGVEIYETDPASEPDTSKWLTKVMYRVAQ